MSANLGCMDMLLQVETQRQFLPPCTNNDKLPKCIIMLRPFTPDPNVVLLSLARGWGTCGSGLGVLTRVVADNSE
jgi:hypothetical protein